MYWSSLFTKRNLLAGLIALIVAALAVTGTWAQTGTTSIRGTVTDKSGAAVSGAKLSLVNVDQGLHREASTNASGEYEFAVLPPGTYVLTVQMTGFRTFE